MSELIIKNRIITGSLSQILYRLKSELPNGKLKDIIPGDDNFIVTCPTHKGGMENHPSCFILNRKDTEHEFGTMHCFTCQESGPLYHFIAECFDEDDEFGKNWLVSRFGEDLFVKNTYILPEIEFNKKEEIKILDESILDTFEHYHPYMDKRKLTKETCERFKVRFDKDTNSLVFPVWDRYDRLRFLTGRNVDTKSFIIDKGSDKSSIYLLNYILKENIKTVVVVESQINALTMWQYGYPAIALFGSGTSDLQMEEINNTPIRHFILAYDNDSAGLKGAGRFNKLIRKDVLVDEVVMPEGKDCNDLTKEEIDDLFSKYY